MLDPWIRDRRLTDLRRTSAYGGRRTEAAFTQERASPRQFAVGPYLINELFMWSRVSGCVSCCLGHTWNGDDQDAARSSAHR